MNYLWAFMILSGVLFSAFHGTIPAVTGAVLDSAKEAVTLCITMTGVMSFWMGLMRIAERGGVIAGLSKKLKQKVSTLSGGEKQRIAIARSLINNTKILILDESTSALDNETAYNLESSLLSIDDLTLIVVTHKLIKNILLNYDEIIVMKDGMVIEKGSFDYLISLKGYFYSLYYLQNEDI